MFGIAKNFVFRFMSALVAGFLLFVECASAQSGIPRTDSSFVVQPMGYAGTRGGTRFYQLYALHKVFKVGERAVVCVHVIQAIPGVLGHAEFFRQASVRASDGRKIRGDLSKISGTWFLNPNSLKPSDLEDYVFDVKDRLGNDTRVFGAPNTNKTLYGHDATCLQGRKWQAIFNDGKSYIEFPERVRVRTE